MPFPSGPMAPAAATIVYQVKESVLAAAEKTQQPPMGADGALRFMLQTLQGLLARDGGAYGSLILLASSSNCDSHWTIDLLPEKVRKGQACEGDASRSVLGADLMLMSLLMVMMVVVMVLLLWYLSGVPCGA